MSDRTPHAAPTPPPPPFRAKLLGGKYEPVTRIGEGGMAVVWEGYTHGEAGFRRKVAIKRVHAHLVNDERFERMFVEEAHIVAELNHPNIVQIHDFGRDREGGYYIVMEWVDGLNMLDYTRAHAIANMAPAWPLASAIAIEVLRALSAAHAREDAHGKQQPVVHRDVTPANILIGVNGCVKLTDFGLSRAFDRPRTTDPGTVKGKVAYLAPELLENEQADPRCDLYSVGVTLWEAVAGRRLFGGKGSDVDIALRVLEGNVPSLQSLRSDIPPQLAAIVERALAPVDDRWARATEMIDALSALLRTHDQPTDGPSIARSVREARRLLSAIAASQAPEPA